MDEYTSWCDEEANEKEDAITSSKRTIGDLEATIADAKATIGSLTSSIDELTSKISSSEAELSKATELRKSENADFVASEKELLGTVDSLERATSVLKKNLGLLQSGRVVKDIAMLETRLAWPRPRGAWRGAMDPTVARAVDAPCRAWGGP